MRSLLFAVMLSASMMTPLTAAGGKTCGPTGPVDSGAARNQKLWPEGPGYAGSTCTFDWVEISGTGVGLQLGDDDYDGPFGLGFEFPLFDRTIDEVWIASNGYLDFNTGSSAHIGECPILGPFGPTYIVAPMWGDLLPGETQDTIFYQAFADCPLGSGPCFVVQWQDICFFPGGPDCDKAGTFEAIVYPNGRVVMQFLDAGILGGWISSTGIAGGDLVGDHQLTYACYAAGSLTDGLCLQMDRGSGLFTYIVGGVAHVEGSQGTAWRSSLSVTSTSAEAADLVFTMIEASGQTTVEETLGAGEIKAWDDVTETLFGLGRDAAGSVTVEADGRLVLTVRTYNQTAQGTYGQYLPGFLEGAGLPPSVLGRLPHLASDADYRTNIGFVNLSNVQCSMDYELFDHMGVSLAPSRRVTLAPFGWKQVNRVFDGLGAQSIAYAKVGNATGNCRAWAYASVVDENTGDPTTIPLRWLQ